MASSPASSERPPVSALTGPEPIIVEVPRDLREVVTLYLETRGGDLARLDQAARSRNLNEIRAIGHRLQGSSASLGFAEAGDIGAGLERAAVARDYSAIDGLIARLREYFARIRIRHV